MPEEKVVDLGNYLIQFFEYGGEKLSMLQSKGLSNDGRPEVVMFMGNLSEANAVKIFEDSIKHLYDIEFSPGIYLGVICKSSGEQEYIKYSNVETEDEEYPFGLIQILIPDINGVFPDESGYDNESFPQIHFR